MYLVCLDHDPPLRAEDESGQHTYDLEQIQKDVHRRDAFVAMADADPDYGHHFRNNTARFLVRHRKCRIGIEDEYGREYPVVDGEKRDVCTCDDCETGKPEGWNRA